MLPAVLLNKLQFVAYLYVFDPSARYPDKGLYVDIAATRGHLDMIRFFHECNDPDFFDTRAMHYAATSGHLDIVKSLHETETRAVPDTRWSTRSRKATTTLSTSCASIVQRSTQRSSSRLREAGDFQIWQTRLNVARLLQWRRHEVV